MANKILLASTFRHYFLGIGIAVNDSDHDYHLVFIDQSQKNKLINSAINIEKPFSSARILSIKSKSETKKAYRKKVMSELAALIDTLRPDEIITGNDRRVEFQFSIHYARSELGLNSLGTYVDDGTGSYIHARDYNRLKYLGDKYIDTALRKMAYGHWYSFGKMLGASNWISKAYLTHPELAKLPSSVEKISLSNTDHTNTECIKIYREIIEQTTEKPLLVESNSTLFVLPHESLIKPIYGSLDAFRQKILLISENTSNIYVKYHPRNQDDPLNLSGEVQLLPTDIPIELILITSNFSSVIGDISTALLSAKWINPSTDVQYIQTKSIYSEAIDTLFRSMDISPIKPTLK